jgi:GNAT superfamily N-acetyltransferase
MTLANLSPPSPLDASHDLTAFACGEPLLDDWLKKRAVRNDQSGASRTYVVCDGLRVVGYYCLSAGAVSRAEAPKAMRRNLPNPIPALVLGRLAIDSRFQGLGLGSALLQDAIRRTLQVSVISGVVALLVHAISERAKGFYLSFGFVPCPEQPMTLCLVLRTAENIVGKAQ